MSHKKPKRLTTLRISDYWGPNSEWVPLSKLLGGGLPEPPPYIDTPANVQCPLFDEIEILLPGDSPSINPSLEKMWNSNSSQKRRKTTLLKQLIKLEWMRKGVMSIPLFH